MCRIIIVNPFETDKYRKVDFLYKSVSEQKVLENDSYITANQIIKVKGMEFQCISDKPLVEKVKNEELINFVYDDNKSISVVIRHNGFYTSFLSDKQKQQIADYYGKDILDDEYRLIKKSLEITPNDVSMLGFPLKRVKADLALLDLKLSLPNNEKDISFFETDDVNGFHRGIFSERMNLLHVFSTDNKTENFYEIVLLGSFDQKEIDKIISTIKFTNSEP